MQDLSPDQVVALASCFIWQERAEAGQKVREDMQGPYGALCEAARTVAKVSALHALSALYAVRCLHALQQGGQADVPQCIFKLPVLWQRYVNCMLCLICMLCLLCLLFKLCGGTHMADHRAQ